LWEAARHNLRNVEGWTYPRETKYFDVVDSVTLLGLEHSRGRHGARYAIVAVVRRLRGCVCIFTQCCDDMYSNNDKYRTLNREKRKNSQGVP
jgi:hypothetical protein